MLGCDDQLFLFFFYVQWKIHIWINFINTTSLTEDKGLYTYVLIACSWHSLHLYEPI